ncbi:MAG: hypothetical protein HC828_10890, partial [Blastochloris sp.]|nr:hypothetical protein [Blastochloris sp.]
MVVISHSCSAGTRLAAARQVFEVHAALAILVKRRKITAEALPDLGGNHGEALAKLVDETKDRVIVPHLRTRHEQTGRHRGLVFTLGQPLPVRLVEANTVTGGLVFAPDIAVEPARQAHHPAVVDQTDHIKAARNRRLRAATTRLSSSRSSASGFSTSVGLPAVLETPILLLSGEHNPDSGLELGHPAFAVGRPPLRRAVSRCRVGVAVHAVPLRRVPRPPEATWCGRGLNGSQDGRGRR